MNVSERPAPATGIPAAHLLHGKRNQWAHLDERFERLLQYAQRMVKDEDRSDAAAAAPYDPKVKRDLEMWLSGLLQEFMQKESFASREEGAILICLVIDEILGLGPIEPLWRDPAITEVMVNGPQDVWAEIGGRIVPVPGARFTSQERLAGLCQRILAPLNRTIDYGNVTADGRLPDGSRVNVVHHSIAPGGPFLTIRKHQKQWNLLQLVEAGSLSEEIATEIAFYVRHKLSLVVVGGTGSGKTSLLNALAGCIPAREERIVTIEDALELKLPHPHWLALEARPATPDGRGEVTIRTLVRNALRMRPSRIVVGESRGPEALDMLQAMNTGHEGSLTTVHANGAEEAVTRLATLVAQGGEVPDSKIQWLISDALDLMVVQSRYEDGSRRVSGVYEVPPFRGGNGQIEPIPLWEWEQTGEDSDGRYVGQYVRRNELSERLRRLRRLDHHPRLSMEDIARFATEGAE